MTRFGKRNRRGAAVVRWTVALSVLSAAGCQATDPFLRQGYWNPRGTNNANLATMVDDPMDLVRGRGDGPADGNLAAAAVTRLRRDRVKSLPDIETSQISSGGTSGGSQQGGAAGGAEAQ